MLYTDLKEKIFRKASTRFDQYEIFINSTITSSVSTYNDELKKYEVSETGGISFRGILGNKEGYAYSENISEDSIDYLLESALQVIESTDENEEIYIYKPDNKESFERNIRIDRVDSKELIEKARSMDSICRSVSDEIHQVEGGISEVFFKEYIANSYGVEKYEENKYYSAGCYVIIKKGEEMKGNSEYQIKNSFEELEIEKIAKKAVDLTEKDFGAETIKSGKYDVVIKNSTFASLINNLISSLSAHSVQKKMSPFSREDIGEKIGSELLTISEKKKIEGLDIVFSFDGEGIYKESYNYIKNGVLTNFAHSIETATKDGIESNASSQRGYKYKAVAGIGMIEVEEGDLSYDELLSKMDNGLVITAIQGLHSGLNAVSGEFSLPCNGYLVESGKEVRAVNQIIISSNVKELLNNIEAIGNDSKIGYLYKIPSVLISNINVSGE